MQFSIYDVIYLMFKRSRVILVRADYINQVIHCTKNVLNRVGSLPLLCSKNKMTPV